MNIFFKKLFFVDYDNLKVVDFQGKDTGLRSTFSGKLFVDKTVFYKRPEVIQNIQNVKKSYNK
jgi:hypothetical protein